MRRDGRNWALIFMEGFSLILVLALCIWLVPGITVSLTLSFTVIYLVVKSLYSFSVIAHNLGKWILISVSLLMAVGIIVNIWYFTEYSGGTLAEPVLHNSDSAKLFNAALSHYNGDSSVYSEPFRGYPIFISLLWKVTGVSVAVPLVINFAFTLFSVLISGAIATKLLKGRVAYSNMPVAGAFAMLMTSLCCYYIGCGMVILKEPCLYLGVGLAVFALAGLAADEREDSGNIVIDSVLLGLGCAITAFNRVGFLYIILIGILIFITRKNWKRSVLFASVVVVFGALNYVTAEGAFDRDSSIVKSELAEDSYFFVDTESGSHSAYNETVDGYFEYPLWKKVLYLPLSASVQYFIPFSWTYENSIPYGPTQVYNHFGYLWYIVGGIIIFFVLFHWRYTPRIRMGRWVLFCLVSYLVPAFLFAGTVSRYWLPFLPAYVAIASYVLVKYKEGQCRTELPLWMTVYVVIVAAVLVVCYSLTA